MYWNNDLKNVSKTEFKKNLIYENTKIHTL